MSDQEIPVDIGSLYALQELDLTENSLSSLPQSFKHLTNLESLYLDNWNDICLLPELPSCLRRLVPSTSRSHQFNVFLSFRGSDTRDTFTSKLYTSLVEAEIHTFMDDDELNAGGIVSHELIPAIEESRIAIIVLSTNYASSTWCLQNLMRVIECHRSTGKVLLPIYYHLDQRIFAKAFQKHKEKHVAVGGLDEMERWQTALSYAADLSGFSLHDFSGCESSLISHIVKEVLWELKKLFVAVHPVGLGSRLEKVRSLLELESNEVRLIAIRGEVGSGKTVIAKALYNESLRHFDSCCFLEDIATVSARRQNGLVYLQNQLVYQFGMGENGKVESVDEGKEVIKKMCSGKKVLIVVDGLGDKEQAYALIRQRDWYGPGSRIIIVSDQSLKWHHIHDFTIDAIYITERLSRKESVELVSLHSFGTTRTLPTDDYDMFAGKLDFCCEGNAIAIVVLGTSLSGRSIGEWRSALERAGKHRDIKEIYDRVRRNTCRKFRLNYVTFHIFIRTAYVIEMFTSDVGVKSLLDKSLPPNWEEDPLVQELLLGIGIRSPFPVKLVIEKLITCTK